MDIQPFFKELAVLGVTTLTQESIKLYVNTRIKPIFANWGKEESRSIELEECISEYLLKCYTKNIIMNTIVFGRLKKTLDDLYIPLTLEEYKNRKKKWIINENCYDILKVYNKVLIIDKAGMGKSTIIKYFACQAINLNKSIPIVIELRKLYPNQSILEFINKQLASFDKNIEKEDIVKMLNKGEFVVFFDGYDEVPNDNKTNVLDQIQDFVSNARNTRIVITSREEDDLNSLGDFKCVTIKPLAKKEAYDLIRKYDGYGDISEKLIQRLERDSSLKVLHEFLVNPLLVSLLYKTFEYKEEIPYKKIDFYNQAYEALFNDHDKTKGSAYVHEKKTKLDRFQFEKILRAFGFLSLKFNKIEFTAQMIYQFLEQSINRFSWLKICVNDFLYDIIHAVPFVQQEGTEYKWIHKSFMEYFASCFICYDNKEFEENHFQKMIYQYDYYNVLDFCYDIDPLGFRKYAILPFLTKFIDRYDKYFVDPFFCDYDKGFIEKAKQLMAISDILSLVVTDDINQEVISKLVKHSNTDLSDKNVAVFYDCKASKYIVCAYNNNAIAVYDVMQNHMPKLFDKTLVYRSLDREIFNYVTLKEPFTFDDDINNFIYSKKNLFYKVVDTFYAKIFPAHEFLIYDKCKELIIEIDAESSNNNSDIFEL